MLLSCELLISLIEDLTTFLNICHWIPIITGVLIIPMWLGSPGHFWFIGYLAMVSTFVGTIVLVIDLAIQLVQNGIADDFHVESFEEFTAAFGTILYSYSGAVVFPTIQNDMKEKKHFPQSVMLGFASEFTI